MGFPSCLENDTERAYDRLFMAGLVQPAFQTLSSAIVQPPVSRTAPHPHMITVDPSAHAKRIGDLRDIHYLCLLELRPRVRAH
jgi:hypothetical protein